jgi:hypothetical protein
MPRGRGGKRQGTPGTSYGNRSDLNMPISTVPNQEYGKAAMQKQAQQAVPMGQSPVSAAPAESGAPQATASVPLPRPGSLPYISPTARPNEPVTAGLPFGPGADSVRPPEASLGDIIRSVAGSSTSGQMLLSSINSLGL